MMRYSELQVTSNFSFLRGASHPEELIERAARLGYRSIALTDHHTLAGVVRAHVAAKKHGIQFIPAARLDFIDGTPLLAYPTNRAAYSRLSLYLHGVTDERKRENAYFTNLIYKLLLKGLFLSL